MLRRAAAAIRNDVEALPPQSEVHANVRKVMLNSRHYLVWPPAVALAVADWLDREAEIWEAVLVRAVQYAPKVEIAIGLSTHEQATAVAAAYLGEEPP